jgi:hypothetical protein
MQGHGRMHMQILAPMEIDAYGYITFGQWESVQTGQPCELEELVGYTSAYVMIAQAPANIEFSAPLHVSSYSICATVEAHKRSRLTSDAMVLGNVPINRAREASRTLHHKRDMQHLDC